MEYNNNVYMISDWCSKMAYAVILCAIDIIIYKLYDNMCWRDVVCTQYVHIQLATAAKVSSVNNLSRRRRDFFRGDRFVIGRVNRATSVNRKTKNTYAVAIQKTNTKQKGKRKNLSLLVEDDKCGVADEI